MAPDAYHGYATESDYHEHYYLLGLLEVERGAAERIAIEADIQEILNRRIYVEFRTVRSA